MRYTNLKKKQKTLSYMKYCGRNKVLHCLWKLKPNSNFFSWSRVEDDNSLALWQVILCVLGLDTFLHGFVLDNKHSAMANSVASPWPGRQLSEMWPLRMEPLLPLGAYQQMPQRQLLCTASAFIPTVDLKGQNLSLAAIILKHLNWKVVRRLILPNLHMLQFWTR